MRWSFCTGFDPESARKLPNFALSVRSVLPERYDLLPMTDDSKRELWSAAEEARESGWHMEMSGNGHLMLRSPHGGNLVLTGVASAHRRTAGNVKALVCRYGQPDT